MTLLPVVTDVVFLPAHPTVLRIGLLGTVECFVNGFLFDAPLIIRTKGGGRAVLYAVRRGQFLGMHRLFECPTDKSVRADIERQILAALEEQGVWR